MNNNNKAIEERSAIGDEHGKQSHCLNGRNPKTIKKTKKIKKIKTQKRKQNPQDSYIK